MDRNVNRLSLMSALAVGIALLTAAPSNAQQGKFNLPVSAHWGPVLLEPGEHSVQIPQPVGQTLVYLTDGKSTQVTVPLTTEPTWSNKNCLHLAKINGEYYVESFESGSNGKKFIFPKPKSLRSASAGARDEVTLISVHEN